MRAGTAEDETIQAFATRRFGREVAASLVDPVVSGIYAGDAARLSMRAAFPAIWELERSHGSLVRGMFAKRRQRANAEPSQRRPGRLVSFADGLETLPEALARALGDRVRTRQEVIGIEPVTAGDSRAARWRISVRAGDVLEADQIVIAGHPSRAAPLAAPFDPELSALLESIPSAPVAVVALGYPRAAVGHPLDGFGFLVPRSEGLRTLGVLWESRIFPFRAPSGYVLLRAILGGAHDPAIVTLEDRELVATVTGELQPPLAVSAPPAFSYVVRHRTGIPQCTLGHAERMTRLDDALGRWRGLHLTGWGYRGVSINQGIAEATRLAARLITVQP
jgi:oxygen-dependent protoporphyrinogen oxidase